MTWVALAALTIPAYAQQNCGPHDKLVEILAEKFGESRIVIAVNPKYLWELFLNSQTGSFTAVHTTPDQNSCVESSGDNFNFDIDGLTNGATGVAWR